MKKAYLVIGGGFFGMYIAAHISKKTGKQVILCEKESDFMLKASYVNQARVHNGYHYPRSVLTALRSRISFPRFCEEFPDTIVNNFDKYYMIGKVLGKVNANQYERFCRRIGAYCEVAPQKIRNLTNPKLIEAVYSTVEYAFDAEKLKENMIEQLNNAGVKCYLNSRVESVRKEGDTLYATITDLKNDDTRIEQYEQIFNCTYSMINYLPTNSGFPSIPLKHEMTEMCLVEVPDEIKPLGITVMCGPFFSTMPFPPKKMHSFSHVRYTPHYEWKDGEGAYVNAHAHFDRAVKNSAWNAIIHDAARYIPVLSECRYIDSLWEVKTVLPRSEVDDSRPILFKQNYCIKGFHSIMGGKIDNVYDAVEIINKLV